MKKLRRKGIATHAEANEYIAAEYLGEHNRRFGCEPREVEDYHSRMNHIDIPFILGVPLRNSSKGIGKLGRPRLPPFLNARPAPFGRTVHSRSPAKVKLKGFTS